MASSLNGTGVTFSNGSTQAVAWPGNTGTVTSVATGNGLTGGTITTSGTISLDLYTGTTSNNASFPIGTVVVAQTVYCEDAPALNSTVTIFTNTSAASTGQYTRSNIGGPGAVQLAGTWRCRGRDQSGSILSQRIA